MTPTAIVGDEVFASRTHLDLSVVLWSVIFMLQISALSRGHYLALIEEKIALMDFRSAREDGRC